MSFWKKLLGESDATLTPEPSEQINQPETEMTDSGEVEGHVDSADSVENLSTDDGQRHGTGEQITSSDEPVAESHESEESIDHDDANGALPEEIVPALTPEEMEAKAIIEREIKAAQELEEAEAAKEKLRLELEEAEAKALAEQLEIEQQEFLEDLSVLDGRILPQLKVPNWREELEFVKERYEPCDLSDHIVKVSKRRLTARQIDHELAVSRLHAYNRYLERASRRFRDKIDEDALLKTALSDLGQWRINQGKSVAWRLADRVNEEVLKAKQAEEEATSFIEENTVFTNPDAVKIYRDFARKAFLIPLVTLYLTSVVGLTYNRFEWILKFFPFFNLGLSKVLIMISGIASVFWLSNLWKYSRHVARIQRKLVAFTAKHEQQHAKIKHAVKQHTRLSQQQPMVEPILKVLAKAYRVQLQSDVTMKAHVTTNFDPAVLPACVTLARAVDDDEEKMKRLKTRALSVLMSPGWRTRGLDEIAKIHADSKMIDSNSLKLKSLDTDSLVSATNAQRMLLEAFENTSIHDRVSRARLVSAIKDLHFEVLANWNSDDRPMVTSLRDDGFSKISFRTSWIEDEDVSQDWLEFLMEILSEETAPFGSFNIRDKDSSLNKPELISSAAVVPHYFELKESSIDIRKSPAREVMPIDVAVRVDVSPWASPTDFAVFADGNSETVILESPVEEIEAEVDGGGTSA